MNKYERLLENHYRKHRPKLHRSLVEQGKWEDYLTNLAKEYEDRHESLLLAKLPPGGAEEILREEFLLPEGYHQSGFPGNEQAITGSPKKPI